MPEDLRDHAPLGDDRDDPHRRAARAEERIDFVDAADQRGPVLPELLAFGRIGLGGSRRMGGRRAADAANLAASFPCIVSDGSVDEISYGRPQKCLAAVDEVRREGVRNADGDQKRSLKSTRWALLKNPWNLTRRESQKLSALQRTNRQIYRAYLLKESFQQIYDAPSATEADKLFSEWYTWARRSRLEPFRKFAATIERYWPAVRRFLEVKLTNAIVEGTSSKIRMISHRAFGFHSAAALVAMIYLNCSNIAIPFIGW